MKKTNSILEYHRDFKEYVESIPEPMENVAEDPVSETLTIEEQLADLHMYIAKLALFVGMPQTVLLDESVMTLYPAREGGVCEASKNAVSYTINLKPFRKLFAAVRFKAMTNFDDEKDIVRGIIVDDNGNVECTCDNRCEKSHLWTRLPITENSGYLVATVPLKDGKPLWTPKVIQFFPRGLAMDVMEFSDGLLNNSIYVDQRLTALEKCCKAEECH